MPGLMRQPRSTHGRFRMYLGHTRSPGETLAGYPCLALMPWIGVGGEISRRPAAAAGLAIRTGMTRLDGAPRPAGPRHRARAGAHARAGRSTRATPPPLRS